ncbi:MAG: hypothetical protein LBI43_02385 [Streptococcaceae bacterium]|nr:hypothetical protein [Streptococcaceae bacterium]
MRKRSSIFRRQVNKRLSALSGDKATLVSSATLTQAGTYFTSLYLPPWTSRPNKQKQNVFEIRP